MNYFIDNGPQVRAVLYDAAEKLKGRWAQRYLALDEGGNPVQPNSAVACRFCLSGIIHHLLPDDYALRTQVLGAVAMTLHDEQAWQKPLPAWNDVPGRTEEEVIQVLYDTADRLP